MNLLNILCFICETLDNLWQWLSAGEANGSIYSEKRILIIGNLLWGGQCKYFYKISHSINIDFTILKIAYVQNYIGNGIPHIHVFFSKTPVFLMIFKCFQHPSFFPLTGLDYSQLIPGMHFCHSVRNPRDWWQGTASCFNVEATLYLRVLFLTLFICLNSSRGSWTHLKNKLWLPHLSTNFPDTLRLDWEQCRSLKLKCEFLNSIFEKEGEKV